MHLPALLQLFALHKIKGPGELQLLEITFLVNKNTHLEGANNS